MIELAIIILICLSSLLIIIATCALLRSNDIYTMAHIIMIFNCYLVPLILLAIEVRNFSAMSILKIITIGVLNILISNIICHLVLKRAMINKIYPDAEIINKS
ncbi:MAG: hypothetical protein EBT63_01720 [Proteobacteria bacterium]|nr:hypothetical protein [Pseudomonadota bacterium]NCA28352.1 hypothetical protein [Pseudomonadota bacterium]